MSAEREAELERELAQLKAQAADRERVADRERIFASGRAAIGRLLANAHGDRDPGEIRAERKEGRS